MCRSITQADLKEYIDTNYTGPRMVIAAAGGVDHDELVDLANQHFGGLSAELNVNEDAKYCRYTGSELRDRDDSMPVAHVAMAVEGVGHTHPDYWKLMVANSVIASLHLLPRTCILHDATMHAVQPSRCNRNFPAPSLVRAAMLLTYFFFSFCWDYRSWATGTAPSVAVKTCRRHWRASPQNMAGHTSTHRSSRRTRTPASGVPTLFSTP